LTTLENVANVTILDVRTYTNAFVTMNAEGDGKTFFGDVKVRQALVQGVDRAAVVSAVLGGHGEVDPTPIPAGNWAFAGTATRKYPYDQLAAARALDAAGW